VKPSPDSVTADALVIGTGVAGLTAALGLAGTHRVHLITKTALGQGGSSPWAQGGVAAAVGPDDDPAQHARDTLAVGAGLNDPAIVTALAEGGPLAIRRLIDLGARFDRAAGGAPALGREAAHSRRRVLHARGDATGAEIVRALVEAVRRAPGIAVFEHTFAWDLAVRDGRVGGVAAVRADGRVAEHRAPAVVLATGGCGRLYRHTTNPPEVTADGLAMAARAGARLADLEFVQFHPTALAVGSDPMPLITEALRGEGAWLVDGSGHRFMPAAHALAELAPRDVVARAIWREQAAGRQVFLDARAAIGPEFPSRFPTVFHLCLRHGIDPRREPIPVSPAAHYHMGGVAVDGRGRASLAGLWACGEVASSGAHGANRLASNSLLEALVFGARVADDIRRGSKARAPGANGSAAEHPVLGEVVDAMAVTTATRALMWERVGLVRDAAGVSAALVELGRMEDGFNRVMAGAAPCRSLGEARNLLIAGRLIAAAALARRESRGAHFRADVPDQDPRWQRRLFVVAHGPQLDITFDNRDSLPAFRAAALRGAA